MARNPKIELAIQAKDAASKVLDQVAGAVDELNGRRADVTAEADDKASKVLDGVDKGVKNLDGESAEVTARADDKASDELADIRSKLERIDGEEAVMLLKAEGKEARTELYSLQKRLISLDDEEAEVEVRAEMSEARKRLDALDAELGKLDQTVVEPKIEAPDAESAGADAGAGFASNALGSIKAAGIAGALAAVGAAAAAAFSEGMERIQLRAKLKSELDLTSSDVRKAAKEISDVYANGWGESLASVQDSFIEVRKQLVLTGAAAKEQTEDLTTLAVAVGEAVSAEPAELLASAARLTLNGLADDAEHAFDIITAGFQGTANNADDWLDSINEYSQQFAALGLSGEDMLAIFSEGFANGQRDADKLADAIKEVRLRGTADTDEVAQAYQRLGLSADEYREKLSEGGDTARTAFIQILDGLADVEDAEERNAIGVELMGTQYEDIGPKAVEILSAIKGAHEDVSGAAAEVTENLDDTTSQAEMLKRRVEGWAGSFSEWFASDLNKGMFQFRDNIRELGESIPGTERELSGSFAVIAEEAQDLSWWTDISAQSVENLGDKFSDAVVDAAAHERALEANTAAGERYTAQAQAATDALSAMADQQRALADPIFAAMKATENYDAALVSLNEEGGNTLENQRNLFTAALDLDAANATLATSTTNTADEMRAMALDMGFTEAQADALAAAVGETTAKADDFAGEYFADVNAPTAEADANLDRTQGKANALDATSPNVAVSAATGAAEGALVSTTRKADALNARSPYISISSNAGAVSGAIDSAARNRYTRIAISAVFGGLSGGARPRDVGGSVPSGEMALVAEKRPEIVNGELITEPTFREGPLTINSGEATAGLLNAGAVGAVASTPSAAAVTSNVTNNTYISIPQGTTSRDVAQHIRTHERREGLTFRKAVTS